MDLAITDPLPASETLGGFPVRRAQSGYQHFNHPASAFHAINSSREAVTDVVNHKRILIKRSSSSSGEKIINASGKRGIAVAAASTAMSLSANGTMRISRVTE
jgi:hypothetical protein